MTKTNWIWIFCLLAAAPVFAAPSATAPAEERETKAPDDAPIDNKAAPFTSKENFDYRPLNEGQQSFVGFFAGPGLKGLVERPDAGDKLTDLSFHVFRAKEMRDGKKAAEGDKLCARVSAAFYDVAPGVAGQHYKTEVLPGAKKDFCELRVTETDPKALLAEARLLVRSAGNEVWVFRSKITRRMKESPTLAKNLAEQTAFVQSLQPRK